MKPSKEESESSGEENQSLEFEQGLEEIEQALIALKERYQQVKRDRNLQAELQQHAEKLRQSKLPEMKVELKHILQQLEVLEINLESRLFNWRSIKDPFWQIVRFSGLGVIIGWFLKSYIILR
jgi:putative cell wall-binding protein